MRGSSWIFRFVDRTNGTADTGNMNANAQGSRLRANSKCYIDNTSWGACNPMMAWVTPSSTDAIQYGVDVKHQHSDWAMNGNYDNSDSTTVDRSRGLSTFHILEFDSGIIKRDKENRMANYVDCDVTFTSNTFIKLKSSCVCRR